MDSTTDYKDLPPKELKPYEFTKETMGDAVSLIGKASMIVVGYMFFTALLGAFVDFGYLWWVITLSYIVAVGGGIAYCVATFMSNEEYCKQYENDYKKSKKLQS